jgi:hypothetical protein
MALIRAERSAVASGVLLNFAAIAASEWVPGASPWQEAAHASLQNLRCRVGSAMPHSTQVLGTGFSIAPRIFRRTAWRRASILKFLNYSFRRIS